MQKQLFVLMLTANWLLLRKLSKKQTRVIMTSSLLLHKRQQMLLLLIMVFLRVQRLLRTMLWRMLSILLKPIRLAKRLEFSVLLS